MTPFNPEGEARRLITGESDKDRYPLFDLIEEEQVKSIAKALTLVRKQTVEECAKVVETCQIVFCEKHGSGWALEDCECVPDYIQTAQAIRNLDGGK